MDKNLIIEGLYRDHKDHIYNFLARMADDPDLALDVTQQTFVKALSDKNFYQVENPKSYLFTIARNTLYNEFKKKKPTSLDALVENENFEAPDDSETVHDIAEVEDIQLKVEKSIRRMPAKTKELMILRYTEDLTIKEISHITGRTLSDVKVNLHRARIKFETSFTSEMYAKVAISRDQCDTLTALLTPYIDSEISEHDLHLVDKHISGCRICYEDTEKLKRSRTLFNFSALLSAPYLLDQMMGEAMASELDFFSTSEAATGTGPETTTATDNAVTGLDSASKATSATNVSTNIISLKAASIVAASIILTATVIVTVLMNSDEDDDRDALTSLLATPSTTPLPVQKTKLDPDITTIVSFKARNTKTGKNIRKGLKWSIFNIADSNADPVPNKADPVQTSNTASFEMILNSGYYLAKVTYKGKTVESEFSIRDDAPVSIQLEFSDISETARAAPQQKTNAPTIHIRRMETGTHESKPLKVNWNLCVETVKMLKETRSKYPEMWAIQEQALKEDKPEFNLDRGLSPEPNWSKLTENYEDEYFSGEKYALYSEKSDYKVSEDGSCKLNKTTHKSAEIDDGEFSYSINFDSKTAEKYISKIVLEKETRTMYQNLAKNNPLAQMAGKLTTEAMPGKAGSEHEKQALKAIKDLEALTKIAGTETMAGEICEYTVMSEQSSTRICYWKTMHKYPSIVKRPIILGTTVELGKKVDHPMFGNQNIKAILFEQDIKLDDSIFSVPEDIEIDDANYNEIMQDEDF